VRSDLKTVGQPGRGEREHAKAVRGQDGSALVRRSQRVDDVRWRRVRETGAGQQQDEVRRGKQLRPVLDEDGTPRSVVSGPLRSAQMPNSNSVSPGLPRKMALVNPRPSPTAPGGAYAPTRRKGAIPALWHETRDK
jgi:hypothetical protein